MRKAFIQLHLAVFLAGFTGILGRLITLNEGLIVWYRLLITCITMWAIYALLGRIKKISGRNIIAISLVGFVAALHWVTFYGAIKYANVSVALVCFSAIGFFTAILEPLINRKRVDVNELILGLLSISGIALIFHFDAGYKTGIIVGIISAFLAAIFPIYNKRFLRHTNVETLLAWQQTGGLVTLSICMPFYLNYFPSVLLPSLPDLGWLLVLSWLCSVLAFQLVNNSLRRLSAFTVNLTYNLEPVYGILLAFIVYRENKMLSGWFYAGFSIIMIALIIHVLLVRGKHRREQHEIVSE